ncbi:hypothetical protein [Cellulomonas soli]|uniref:PPE family domain-containing protein n=1 Tax=Cellulomonas soli TaxID=931535 RepID=A0A512PIV9_9CELL|nr:hypothetical protein [Cellulomonas soli]NYI58831.1 hypothetical protein [Cellulomonas soli]GEP71072.1 hypothetical protein CSO01_37870 [Cellulomonas soli]
MTKKADDLARTLDADLAALWDYVDRIKALSRSVEDHAAGLRPIAADLGVSGQVEDVAAESLASLATQGVALSDQFAVVSASVSQAREALISARNAYHALPEGGLDGWQAVAVTAAKVAVPGVGTLAGDAAAVYWTAENAKEREAAAGSALQTLKSDLEAASAVVVSGTSWSELPNVGDPTVNDSTESTVSGTSTSGSTRRSVASVATIGSTNTSTSSTTTPLTSTPIGTGSIISTPLTPGSTALDPTVPGSSTSGGSTSADGHLTGGTVPGTVRTGLPGALPGSTVGGAGLGLSGSGIGSGSADSALAGGLAAGVTALGSTGLSRLGSTGGLLGVSGAGGTSGLSSGGSSGVLGGGRSASTASTTLRGTSGSSLVEGSASTTTATGAAGGRSTGSSSGMMPGGGGGAGGGKEKRRRAGGGLIAPGFEDDDRRVAVPLGAGARAGSRDQLPVVLEVEEPDDTW